MLDADLSLAPRQKSSVRWLTISEDISGQRIDNFLRTELKGVPKSLIYRILRKGEVRINKKRIKPEYRLQAGDLLRIPPLRLAHKKPNLQVSTSLTKLLEESVLYEDNNLIVINKPSGLAVHGGSGLSLGLIEALRKIRPEQKYLELVHRLDRDTSGCIMLAKKRRALTFMHQAFQANQVTKIYHTLVIGSWPEQQRRIDAPLRKNELKSGERMVGVDPEGKASITQYRVLQRFSEHATLIEARPVTGRTHQIRVHCLEGGHAILGDNKYAPSRALRLSKSIGVKRLFLHAAELRIPLPDAERLTIKAPLESSLAKVLITLASNNN